MGEAHRQIFYLVTDSEGPAATEAGFGSRMDGWLEGVLGFGGD